MSDYEEDDAPRLGVSTVVVALTVAVIAAAIVYNTLSQSGPLSNEANGGAASDGDTFTGSTP